MAIAARPPSKVRRAFEEPNVSLMECMDMAHAPEETFQLLRSYRGMQILIYVTSEVSLLVHALLQETGMTLSLAVQSVRKVSTVRTLAKAIPAA